jgi:FKBP-type peptidyl-prolyl cis-trans isomerase 2/Tfp pilus assembly protein PilF
MQENMTAKAKFGDIVNVWYTSKLEDGTVLESNIEQGPLLVTIGKSNLLKSFEKSLSGMKPGEIKSIQVSAEEAYGPYKDELKKVLSRTQFPSDMQPEVGMQIIFKQSDQEITYRFVEVTDSSITLDANHPLAGKEILFDIELISILKEGPGALAYFSLGTSLQEKGFLEEASLHYLNAIETDPDFIEAYFNLGVIYHQQGFLDNAISHYQKVLQLDDNHLRALINLGNALRLKGNFDEAITSFNKALLLKPDYASLYNNLGAAFQDKGQLNDAISHYQKAITLDANSAEIYNNLGMAYQENAQYKEAQESFQNALRLDPDLVEAHVNLSSINLLSGQFKEGWDEYEWRQKTDDFSSQVSTFPQPLWDGHLLNGKTLLVYTEQGIGDEIMFASCLPDVIAQTGLCVVECDKRLIPLFTRSFPKAKFFERINKSSAYPSEVLTEDAKIAIGSLPKFFRSDSTNFPPRSSYLVPDPQRLELWQTRFQELGQGLKVGISWRGGQHHYKRKIRSMLLEQWVQILSLSQTHFINLQYGDYASELNEIHEKTGIVIHNWEDANPINDFDDFAAQISALDLVISIDNATVHIAGALGKPVWTLLPFVPDWRWMLEREDSPWYPAMRLFRQPSQGDWKSVIDRVAIELKKISAS